MNKPANSLRLATMGLILLTASAMGAEAGDVPGGDPERGAATIHRYGCGACHKIPGIPGAIGIVGPPLAKMAERGYVGGILANTPENLIRWLLDPPRVDPTTAMPNMGLSEAEARDIAAYLYTLK
jgi:cytochrome c1